MSATAIGIDLGGTRIKVIAIDQNGKTLHHQYHPTNDGDNDKVWKNAIAKMVLEVQNKIIQPAVLDRQFFFFDGKQVLDTILKS